MSQSNTGRARGKRSRRGPFLAAALGLAGIGVAALLLTSGASSLASEPDPAARGEAAGLGSQGWLAGWILVFLALSALYAFERRHRERVALAPAGGDARSRANAAPAARRAAADAERAADAQHRPIELLLKKKPGAPGGERPPPPVAPAPKLNLPEESNLLRRPPGRGAKESGEESFSLADEAAPAPGPVPPAPEPATVSVPGPVAAPARVAEATSPTEEAAAAAVEAAPPARASAPDRLEHCAALRAEGRFDEAARVAREGLTGDDDPGPLLIELSRAELGLGRVNAAIDTARDAHFASRSRESIAHLIHLLIETRRFSRADGSMLRRAAARHPGQALLRHAAGVFESMYGEPRAAEQELREALRLAADAERRAAIARDLARARPACARAPRRP